MYKKHDTKTLIDKMLNDLGKKESISGQMALKIPDFKYVASL